MTTTSAREHGEASSGIGSADAQFVTMTISDQLFGLPVLSVHDVLAPQKITRIPLAPREVAGALNLRGRIVTTIDVREALDLPRTADRAAGMYVVVEHGGEFYSLMIDTVGEVMTLPADHFERTPQTVVGQFEFCWLALQALIPEIMPAEYPSEYASLDQSPSIKPAFPT